MGNCLITKLKETVNNDSLEYLGKGEFLVVVGSSGMRVLNFYHKGEVHLTLISGNANNISTQSYTTQDDNEFVVNGRDGAVHNSADANAYGLTFSGSGSYKFRYDKYNFMPYVSQDQQMLLQVNVNDIRWIIDEIGIPYFATGNEYNWGLPMNGDFGKILSKWKSSQFKLLQKEVGGTYYASDCSGNIAQLVAKTDLTQIALQLCSNITGNLSSLSNHPNKANITTLNFANTPNVEGNLDAVLSNFIALTTFNGENNAKFYGSLDSVAQAFIAAGRQAGTSLVIRGNMTNVSPNPTSGKTISFISDGQGGVTYTIS